MLTRIITVLLIAETLLVAHVTEEPLIERLIERIEVHKNYLKITVNKQFKKEYLVDDFFAEYEPDIDLEQFDYSIVSLPFLLNVISIVWASGKIYSVDEMDRELFHSLQRVKIVFKKMYPATPWEGKVIPQKLTDNKYEFPQKDRTALLFSGGLDSTSSVLGNLDKQPLLITAWGHTDLRLTEKNVWQQRCSKIKSFAQKIGCETTFFRSNYIYFLNIQKLNSLSPEIKKWRLGAVEGLGWAGLTAPILLAKGYATLRIASSHTWHYPYPAAASPFIDNNLKYAGLRVIHDQFDMTRLMKTVFIAKTCKEKKIDPPFLKVCTEEKKCDKNCCQCRKCLTTIAGLLIFNEPLNLYGFPLSVNEACGRIQKLLKPDKLNYYTILCFKGMQKKIKERVKEGAYVHPQVASLLSIDLDAKVAFDVSALRKLSWKDMQGLCPDIKIPDEYLTKEESQDAL